MSTLNPKITNAGLALFPNPTLPGFNVALTHIALGTAQYDPDGTEIALQAEVARFPITSGGTPAPHQVQIGATITNQDPDNNSVNNAWVGEIGFFAGATLFAVWSRASAPLFFKTTDFDVALAYTLDVSILPESSVTVNVNADLIGLASMLLDHESDPEAHTQYLRITAGNALIEAHAAADDPHPQYMTDTETADSINQAIMEATIPKYQLYFMGQI